MPEGRSYKLPRIGLVIWLLTPFLVIALLWFLAAKPSAERMRRHQAELTRQAAEAGGAERAREAGEASDGEGREQAGE